MAMPSKEAIESARAYADHLRVMVDTADKVVHDLIEQRLRELHDIKPGDIVTSTRGRVKGKFKVVSLRVHPGTDDHKPWVIVNPIKKDGTPANTLRTLFDEWEKTTPGGAP